MPPKVPITSRPVTSKIKHDVLHFFLWTVFNTAEAEHSLLFIFFVYCILFRSGGTVRTTLIPALRYIILDALGHLYIQCLILIFSFLHLTPVLEL